MELAIANGVLKNSVTNKQREELDQGPNLTQIALNSPHIIKGVKTGDQNMKDFLFTLGCFEGETVTVISALAENYVINVKDARYSIDEDLARAILVL